MVRLVSNLPKSSYHHTPQELTFIANTSHHHFTFKFEPKVKVSMFWPELYAAWCSVLSKKSYSPSRICTPKLTKNMVKLHVWWKIFGCPTQLMLEITEVSIFFCHVVSCTQFIVTFIVTLFQKFAIGNINYEMISWSITNDQDMIIDKYHILINFACVQKISLHHGNKLQSQLPYWILFKWKCA